MIGGGLRLNWDASGAFYMSGGTALFVNAFIENNNENPVMIADGTGVFINTTIAGNRGTTGSNANMTITTTGTTSRAALYNSVVRNNLLQTYGTGVRFYNTIAPDIYNASVIRGVSIPPDEITESLPDGLLANEGEDGHYPLTPEGDWNNTSPGYNVIMDTVGVVGDPDLVGADTWEKTLLKEIKAALSKDGTGKKNRFNGTIDLGAEEE
jgi:hypothetical protein